MYRALLLEVCKLTIGFVRSNNVGYASSLELLDHLTSHERCDIYSFLQLLLSLRSLAGLEQLQASASALFPPRCSVFFCVRFARQVVSIEHQVWLYSEVDEHAYAIHSKVDVLPSGLVLGQLDGTGDCATVKPAISVDADCFAGKVTEMSRLVDALEQRQQSY